MQTKPMLAIAGVTLAMLSACSSDSDVPDVEGGSVPVGDLVTNDRIGRPDAPNSFTMQMTQAHSAQSPTTEWADGFHELYTQWAEENPDWQINITVSPAATTTQDQTKLLESVRVGRGPDCAEIDSFMLPQFLEQGELQPVTDLYGGAEAMDNVFPFVRDVVTGDDGEAYAYWWNTDLRVLFRRTDLVPKAPQTWDDLQASALAAKQADSSVDGLLFNGGRWEGTTFDWYSTLWSQGADLVDESGNPAFGEGENRDATIAGLEYYQELVTSGAAPQRVATIMNYDDFLTAAESESVAMFIGGHWQHQQLKDMLDPEQFRKWAVSELPAPEGGQTTTGTGGWTVGVFSDDPEIAEACKSFIDAVYAGPANDLTGQLPTSTTLFDELETFKSPVFQQFRAWLENGRARPGSTAYGAISSALQVAIGQVLTGQESPEDATDQAFEAAVRESD